MTEQLFYGKTWSEWQQMGATFGRWFGSGKDKTKNCEGCSAHKIVDGRQWCLYGVGKILNERERPKACVLVDSKTGRLKVGWPPRPNRSHNLAFSIKFDTERKKEAGLEFVD